jgi:replicative DNA helicase
LTGDTKQSLLSDIQKNILTCAIKSNELLFEVLDKLKANDFFSTECSEIYRTIRLIADENSQVSFFNLKTKIKDDFTLEFLDELEQLEPNVTDFRDHLDYLKDESLKNKLLSKVMSCQSELCEGESSFETIKENLLQSIIEINYGESNEDEDSPEEDIEKIIDFGKHRRGLEIGIPSLHRKLGGFFGGKLVAIGGRPGQGKSLCLIQLANHIAEKHEGIVLFYTMEMDKLEVRSRIISNKLEIPNWRFDANALTEKDVNLIKSKKEGLLSKNLRIIDKGTVTVSDVIFKTKSLILKGEKVNAVFIDYIGLMTFENERRSQNLNEAIGLISKKLKALAKDAKIPVIMAVQLNRKCEELEDKRPRLSHIRDSGNLEQDCNIVLYPYHDYYYTEDPNTINDYEIDVCKNRGGAKGRIHCKINLDYQRIYD